MSLDQNLVMLSGAVVLTVWYCGCGLARKRRLQYDNVLFFGFLSAASIRGIYITIEAFKSGASGNYLYTGLFGLAVTIISAERVKTLIQAMLRKTTIRKGSKPGSGPNQSLPAPQSNSQKSSGQQ